MKSYEIDVLGAFPKEEPNHVKRVVKKLLDEHGERFLRQIDLLLEKEPAPEPEPEKERKLWPKFVCPKLVKK